MIEVRVPAAEEPHSFREVLTIVHRDDRRDALAVAGEDELTLDESWGIVFPLEGPDLLRHAAHDLQDYLATSMGIAVVVRALSRHEQIPERSILIGVSLVPEDVDQLSYSVSVDRDRISVLGSNERAAAQGGYFLEDLMNLRGGPFLTIRSYDRHASFSPRMTHSGYGLDDFPDEYLSLIAHAGMDAVLLFVTGPNRVPDEYTTRDPARRSPGRYLRFEELAQRCKKVGLDLYLYPQVAGESGVHPDDPAAEEYYDKLYGSLFAACPSAKGIVLVGESVEFPSRDPNTSGRMRLDLDPRQLPDDRPTPGWWPCDDFPQWVTLVRDVCRRHSPSADIIFWTYNWGWAPERERLQLIRSLPDDVTVQATFEMFEGIQHDGVANVCVDYTIASIGPGDYFASEAAAAHERGLRLYAITNTAGLTWDFGTVGYQPIPFQWLRRHRAVLAARDRWDLSGLMENHHYGWWPSIVSELAKWSFWSPSPSGEEIIDALARRDFGDGAADAVEAWRLWSEATEHYVPTNADQYGPFRIGPSYPLVFETVPSLVVADNAMFGDFIVQIPYQPDRAGTVLATAAPLRMRGEIASLERMLSIWRSGEKRLEAAIAAAPANRQKSGQRMLNLGRYISHTVQTTLHVKRWWQMTSQLAIEADPDLASTILDRLEELGEAEVANAAAAIGCVEADSRLGWEPTMEYIGDAEHIRWKIAHLRHALDSEIPAYRRTLWPPVPRE